MTTPADIIARTLMCELGEMLGEQPHVTDKHDAQRIIAALDAAGYTIVARDARPATCPTCGSDEPRVGMAGGKRVRVHACPDPWHGEGR